MSAALNLPELAASKYHHVRCGLTHVASEERHLVRTPHDIGAFTCAGCGFRYLTCEVARAQEWHVLVNRDRLVLACYGEALLDEARIRYRVLRMVGEVDLISVRQVRRPRVTERLP